MAEVDKDATKVAVVFLDAVVQGADMRLIQEAQDMLLELATAFAGNDLNQRDPLGNRLLHHTIKLALDPVAAIINVV